MGANRVPLGQPGGGILAAAALAAVAGGGIGRGRGQGRGICRGGRYRGSGWGRRGGWGHGEEEQNLPERPVFRQVLDLLSEIYRSQS